MKLKLKGFVTDAKKTKGFSLGNTIKINFDYANKFIDVTDGISSCYVIGSFFIQF